MQRIVLDRGRKTAILMLIAAFVLAMTVIRAAVTEITYDEAFTYMAYSLELRLSDLSSLRYIYEESVANNHWLNTLAIAVVDRLIGVYFCEFVIRIPNLVAFAVYCVYVCAAYRKKMISFICASFLLFNYYLDEFYGLARGYAMAQTFIFTAAYYYMLWKGTAYREHGNLVGCALSLMLSAWANTVTLLVYPAFGILWLWHLIKEKQFLPFLKKWIWFVVLFLLSSLFLLRYHLKISEWGMPLFTGHEDFYHSVVRTYLEMLTSSPSLILLLLAVLCVVSLLAVVILKKEIINCDLTVSLGIFIVTNILMNILMKRGYITERAAVPFYGYIVLSIFEFWHAAWERLDRKLLGLERKRKAHAIITVLVVFALGFHFLNALTLESTTDWSHNYGRRDRLLAGYLTTGEFPELEDQELNSCNDEFYRVKYWYIINTNP